MEHIEVLGLSFIEFTGSRPNLLRALFQQMGLSMLKSNVDEQITLHHQGDIHFVSNPSTSGNVLKFREVHGRGASAMGFIVRDAKAAHATAIKLGAEPAESTNYPLPAIHGIGQSLIYFVDEAGSNSFFEPFGYRNTGKKPEKTATNLCAVDHLTHNLNPGGIEKYKTFYGRLFGFQSVRSFLIEGKKTGLYSEVIMSPSGEVIIPLNETRDEKSQIAEFIREYNGEGIQHIALRSSDIYETVGTLTKSGIEFQDTPDTYYELLAARLPSHGEPLDKLKALRILVDGGESQGGGYLLQIFTKNSVGPIFFEYIQRKGNNGFGEGNFQALFESIELDQERRGVI